VNKGQLYISGEKGVHLAVILVTGISQGGKTKGLSCARYIATGRNVQADFKKAYYYNPQDLIQGIPMDGGMYYRWRPIQPVDLLLCLDDLEKRSSRFYKVLKGETDEH
jgi:hypothetical protein